MEDHSSTAAVVAPMSNGSEGVTHQSPEHGTSRGILAGCFGTRRSSFVHLKVL